MPLRQFTWLLPYLRYAPCISLPPYTRAFLPPHSPHVGCTHCTLPVTRLFDFTRFTTTPLPHLRYSTTGYHARTTPTPFPPTPLHTRLPHHTIPHFRATPHFPLPTTHVATFCTRLYTTRTLVPLQFLTGRLLVWWYRFPVAGVTELRLVALPLPLYPFRRLVTLPVYSRYNLPLTAHTCHPLDGLYHTYRARVVARTLVLPTSYRDCLHYSTPTTAHTAPHPSAHSTFTYHTVRPVFTHAAALAVLAPHQDATLWFARCCAFRFPHQPHRAMQHRAATHSFCNHPYARLPYARRAYAGTLPRLLPPSTAAAGCPTPGALHYPLYPCIWPTYITHVLRLVLRLFTLPCLPRLRFCR